MPVLLGRNSWKEVISSAPIWVFLLQWFKWVFSIALAPWFQRYSFLSKDDQPIPP